VTDSLGFIDDSEHAIDERTGTRDLPVIIPSIFSDVEFDSETTRHGQEAKMG
jgi:hypothetical protein